MELAEYQPMIDGILRKLRVPAEQKEDMQQECYVEILTNQEKIEASEFPLSYAETACRNRILDMWRKEGRTVQTDSLDEPKIQGRAEKVPAPVTGITRDMLAEALGGLNNREHQAVLLVHVEEYTYAEAAEEMEISVDAIRQLVRSGIGKLREYFI